MGARPLARIIQEYVKKPLAEEVLFGKLSKGGTVRILMKDGALDFAYLSREEEWNSLPRPPERKALPRATKPKGEGGGGKKPPAKKRKAKA